MPAVDLVRAHRGLPIALKLPVVATCCLGLAIFLGIVFPLPPGPLCDEGMLLFMEGGCDWGGSNLFFMAKVALMITTLVVGVAAGRLPTLDRAGFLPHLFALITIALLPGMSDGGVCETYYGHPNGNFAQMLIEQAALGGLVLAVVPLFSRRGLPQRILSVAGVMLISVAVFYGWLQLTPHWTWLHTLLVAGSLLVVAAALEFRGRSAARSPG